MNPPILQPPPPYSAASMEAVAALTATARAAAATHQQQSAKKENKPSHKPGNGNQKRPSGAKKPSTPSIPSTKQMKKSFPVGTPLHIPAPNAILPSMEGMQLYGIPPNKIHAHDVLCGRGGGSNNHLGNAKFRELVNGQKVLYLHASKRDKPFVSRGIVRAIRAQRPPGRFLQRDEKTGYWHDIGDQKAREKTSQALRENAPEIRREMSTAAQAASPGFTPLQEQIAHNMAREMAEIHALQQPKAVAREAFAEMNAMQHVRAFQHQANAKKIQQLQQAQQTQQQIQQMQHVHAQQMQQQMQQLHQAQQMHQVQHLHQVQQAQQIQHVQQMQIAAAAAAASPAKTPAAFPIVGYPSQATPATPSKQASYVAAGEVAGVTAATATPAAMATAAPQAVSAVPVAGFAPPMAVTAAAIPVPAPGIAPGMTATSVAPAVAPTMAAVTSPVAPAIAPTMGANPMAAVAVAAAAGVAVPGFASSPVIAPPPVPQQNARTKPVAKATTSKTKTHNGGAAVRKSSTFASRRGVSKSEAPTYLKDRNAQRLGQLPPHKPLSHEATRRLILAETVAQKTVNNSISKVLKAEEYRVNMYLDCGLLGIKPADILKEVKRGGTEERLVEKSYKRLKSNVGASDDDLAITAGSLIDRYAKRHKGVAYEYARSGIYQLTDHAIEEAIVAIGG